MYGWPLMSWLYLPPEIWNTVTTLNNVLGKCTLNSTAFSSIASQRLKSQYLCEHNTFYVIQHEDESLEISFILFSSCSCWLWRDLFKWQTMLYEWCQLFLSHELPAESVMPMWLYCSVCLWPKCCSILQTQVPKYFMSIHASTWPDCEASEHSRYC